VDGICEPQTRHDNDRRLGYGSRRPTTDRPIDPLESRQQCITTRFRPPAGRLIKVNNRAMPIWKETREANHALTGGHRPGAI
jgi:hypothetical protein